MEIIYPIDEKSEGQVEEEEEVPVEVQEDDEVVQAVGADDDATPRAADQKFDEGLSQEEAAVEG